MHNVELHYFYPLKTLQCLNYKATQYMGGGIRIRNVTLTSSDLFTVTNVS